MPLYFTRTAIIFVGANFQVPEAMASGQNARPPRAFEKYWDMQSLHDHYYYAANWIDRLAAITIAITGRHPLEFDRGLLLLYISRQRFSIHDTLK